MKQGVLQDESMEIHVASMKTVESSKNMKKQQKNWRKQWRKETKWNLKQDTSMEQEPYPNQEDGRTRGLHGSGYQLMDVLGIGEEGDPWKTPKRWWNVAEMKIRARRALGNGGFWWRWRVEVELWYGRWVEEMKEKVNHVYSQNNRRVKWSQHTHLYLTTTNWASSPSYISITFDVEFHFN